MTETVEIIARDVPAEIVAALVFDARTQDVTKQEAAISILCSAFRVKRTPSRRRFIAGTAENGTLILSVPARLRDKIHRRAFETRGTMRGVICSTLASHYELPDVPLGRRPRG